MQRQRRTGCDGLQTQCDAMPSMLDRTKGSIRAYPSTAKLRVALGMRTLTPSSSFAAMT